MQGSADVQSIVRDGRLPEKTLYTHQSANLVQKFDSQMNLPTTPNDISAKMSRVTKDDAGRWHYIFHCIPPIASGYRGSRTNATLEDIMPMTNQFHFCNSRPNSNNNLCRTTCVATNLRSYSIPVNHDNTHDDLQGHQSNGRYC